MAAGQSAHGAERIGKEARHGGFAGAGVAHKDIVAFHRAVGVEAGLAGVFHRDGYFADFVLDFVDAHELVELGHDLVESLGHELLAMNLVGGDDIRFDRVGGGNYVRVVSQLGGIVAVGESVGVVALGGG